jgi:hypothetical protein
MATQEVRRDMIQVERTEMCARHEAASRIIAAYGDPDRNVSEDDYRAALKAQAAVLKEIAAHFAAPSADKG